jgi:hypothetical protein
MVQERGCKTEFTTSFLERSILMRKIIDFHAHIFNPKIAHLAIANLEQHYGMPWQCKGTFTDMKEEMEKSGFYKAVIFSTPTKPTQVEINNNFLFDLRDDRFIVFGSVHPDYENVGREIQRVKNHRTPETAGQHSVKSGDGHFHNDKINHFYIPGQLTIKMPAQQQTSKPYRKTQLNHQITVAKHRVATISTRTRRSHSLFHISKLNFFCV